MKSFFLPGLLLPVVLLLLATASTAQTLPINFNFQSTTMPSGLSSNGTISTSGSVGTCGVCSPGRINIPVTTGYFQIDVPAVSVANLNMKSSGASARIVTVKYKHTGDPDYVTAGTVSVPQSGNTFELVTLFPAIASSSTTSVRLENGTGGEFHIHDVFVDGSPTLSAEAEITAFTIPGQTGTETINSSQGKVEIQVPSGTSLTSVVPSSVTLSTGATINPSATTARDFSGAIEVPYVVTAQDGTTTKNWTVKVTEVMSSEKEILAFVLSNDQVGNAVINSAAATISVVMPNTVSLTSITPVTLTVSANATVSPLATAAQNFSSPVQYTVTAQNGSTKVWTVTVTQVPPPGAFDDYEGEQAEFTGTVDNNHTGYTGTGFINFLANGENYIIFNVCQTTAGAQTAKFRYAFGTTGDRIGKLYVNDVFVQDLVFAPTGAWTTWLEETAVVVLQQGMNNIKITWEDTDGPNLDKLSLSGTQCPKYTLTVTATNSGTVSLSPVRYANQYFNVETVTLLAETRPDLAFANWTGDLTGNTNPATLAMTANKTVTANFTPIATYTLQLNTTGVGEVLLSPAGGVYSAGTTVTLTANPVLGSSFQGWSGDATGTSTVTTVQMNSNKSVTAAFTNSASINFETPIGFASVNTGSTYPNFNGPVTGGQNATDTFWVNTAADFDALAWRLYYRNRAYNNQSGTNGVPKSPLVIVFRAGVYPEGTSSSSAWGNHMMTVQEQGDLTIIGQGNVTLKFGFNLKRSWNILIRNIQFQDYYDDGINIGEPETHHIWIDHCTIGHPTTMPSDSEHPDGGADTKSGASYVTISWCLFRNSWKTSLIGHSDGNGSEDIGKLKVTYFANHFLNTNSRNPRVRFGEVHVLNNLCEKIGLYGIASAKEARVVAEGNFYLNTRWPMYADRALADFRSVYGTNTDNVFTSKTGNLPCIYLKQFNNEYDDSGLPVITAQINSAMLNPGGRSIKFDELNPGAAFDPHSYYTYTAFAPSVVRAVVPMFAGAGRVDFFTQTGSTTSTINTNGTLAAFNQVTGTPSAVQTYTVSADNLTANLTITPPAGYEVSANGGTNWFTNASPLSLTPTGGSIASTSISVRLNASVAGNYSGNILHTSTGATDVNVAVSGTAAASQGNWTIYHANELPGAFTPAFVTSQQSGTFSNTILADPDQAGNNLLQMQTAANSDNNQWRQNLAAGTTQLTLAIRAKGNILASNLVFDADLDFGGTRWQTRILSDGNYAIPNGTPTTPGSLGIDPLGWNIYRFTKSGTQTAVYVNENPVPIYTGTPAAAGANNYFRFGDGWGSGRINSNIDWVAWDPTGAFSPADVSLPTILTGGNPEITVTAALGNFTQIVGTPSAIQTYTITAADLTTDLTITPPAGYEVSANGGTNWFTNASPLLITPAGGTIASTTISVRLNATSAGSHAGNILHTSTGAQDVSVAVNGSATNPGNWTIYHANELPGAFTPAFVTSQQSGTFSNTILADPDQAGNNLLQMQTAANSDNNQWRQNLAAGTTQLTLAIRAKGNILASNLVFDADLDFGGTRWQTRILSDGNYAIPNGTPTTPGSLGIDPLGWNIYRFTKSGTQTAVYVNENPVPIYTGTPAAAGANNYFRFGDGWGSGRINSNIDWVAWDPTGAFSPADVSLPPGLGGGNNPVLNITASLNNFVQTVGTPSATQTYTVSGSNLTTSLTITPPAAYEVSADGGANWFNNTTPLVLSPAGGTIASTTITVRLNAAAPGSYTGNITHTSTSITENLAVNGTASAPTAAVISVTASLNAFSQTVGTPSATQTYTVAGSNLTNDVALTAPAGYEISNDGGTNWYNNSNPLTLAHSSGTLTSTTITVRLNAGTAGTYNGNITHASTGAVTQPLALTGTTVNPPSITVTGALVAFTQTVGTPSATQTYTVSGADLTGTVTITPPVGYEVSANGGTNWFSNSSPLVLTGTAGTLANTTITVRLNASTAGSYSGNITHVSASATPRDLAVTGTVVDPPTITTTGTPTAFTQTVGAPSATQTYTVSAVNLTGDVTITAPAGYEVSANGGTNWFNSSNPLVLTGTAGTLASTTITVRLNAATVGSYSGNITHVSPGAITRNVAVSGTTVNPPAISANAALVEFDQTLGAPSAAQLFTIQGSNLVGTVTITAPSGYEVSLNNIDWFGNNNPLVVSGTAGTLGNTTVRVRLNASTTGQHNGDITLQTSGTANLSIAVTGYTHTAMTVAPNPARESISIYHPFLYSTGEIYIYDVNGRRVRTMRTTPASNKTTIDIRALPGGIYTIEYRRKDERETFRFIKL